MSKVGKPWEHYPAPEARPKTRFGFVGKLSASEWSLLYALVKSGEMHEPIVGYSWVPKGDKNEQASKTNKGKRSKTGPTPHEAPTEHGDSVS